MPDTTAISPQRDRRGLTALAGAGLGGLAAFVLAGCGSTDTPGGGDTLSTRPAAQAPTALTLPDGQGPAAACAVLTADTLAAADTAFSATVTTVGDQTVVLAVDTVYTGDPGTTVTIPRPADDLPGELSIGTLTQGQAYLLSTQGDTVLTCGQSGSATPELQALYDDAY